MPPSVCRDIRGRVVLLKPPHETRLMPVATLTRLSSQSIMSNPELMQSIMMQNPQMRAIIEQNPELGAVLRDPNIMRQTMEAARNPGMMQEMMRNQDRQMANISAHPEGFNALRRMYETVQEPMMNAMANQAGGTEPAGGTPAAAAGTAPNSAAAPNPWAAPAPAAPGGAAPNPFAALGVGAAQGAPNPWATAPAGGAGAGGLGGLAGLMGGGGMGGGMGGMGGMGQDPAQMMAMMNNPQMREMMGRHGMTLQQMHSTPFQPYFNPISTPF